MRLAFIDIKTKLECSSISAVIRDGSYGLVLVDANTGEYIMTLPSTIKIPTNSGTVYEDNAVLVRV